MSSWATTHVAAVVLGEAIPESNSSTVEMN